jgi:hypothetical protein
MLNYIGQFWTLWTIVDSFGQLWTILDNCGQFWQLWTIVDNFGQLRTILSNFDYFFEQFGPFGRFFDVMDFLLYYGHFPLYSTHVHCEQLQLALQLFSYRKNSTLLALISFFVPPLFDLKSTNYSTTHCR